MGLKKILLLTSLSLFIFDSCQAGRYSESEEKSYCSKTLRKLSCVFTYLFGDCIGASSRQHCEKIDYGEDYEIEGVVVTESQPIDMLPNELLYQVGIYLSPPDIINLIKSNKKFSCLISNNFWLYYNMENGDHSWDETLPAIRVTFSHYWFNNNKIEKAASLGFPRAQEFFKQRKKLKQKKLKLYKNPSYSRHNHYEEIVPPKFFYMGLGLPYT